MGGGRQRRKQDLFVDTHPRFTAGNPFIRSVDFIRKCGSQFIFVQVGYLKTED